MKIVTNLKEVPPQYKLEALLKLNEVRVTFTKKDGTERVMECTQDLDCVPDEFHPKGETENTKPTDQVRVFDLESNGWRSFNYSKVKEVTVL